MHCFSQIHSFDQHDGLLQTLCPENITQKANIRFIIGLNKQTIIGVPSLGLMNVTLLGLFFRDCSVVRLQIHLEQHYPDIFQN